MLVFSIQSTNVSTKYNTIHSTVVVTLTQYLRVTVGLPTSPFPKERNEMINENKTRHDKVSMFYD